MTECYCDDPPFSLVEEGAPSYEEWMEMLSDEASFAFADSDTLRTYDRDGTPTQRV